MTVNTEPFEELPYRSFSVEWTAPERLAMTSLTHGGPRVRRRGYRMLELGCGTGANLRALAFYRPGGEFVGVDGAQAHVASARADASALGLDNLSFVHDDIGGGLEAVAGTFDFIVAHGVFSWVRPQVRDALLAFVADRLRPDGVFYVGYNARPGWNIRGVVRRLLVEHTASTLGLREQAERARTLAGRLAASLGQGTAPWPALLARELALVHAMEASYVAHDYLAPDNQPFWRDEIEALASGRGLEIIADADHYARAGLGPEAVRTRWIEAGLPEAGVEAAIDLVGFRQHHCPLLGRSPLVRRAPTLDEVAPLLVASRVRPLPDRELSTFAHPCGVELSDVSAPLAHVLASAARTWPRAVRLADLDVDIDALSADLVDLHRDGIVELRHDEPDRAGGAPPLNALNRMEAQRGQELTTAYHTSVSAPA